MKAGRLRKEEQEKRIKQLVSFIFIFRYATRKQLDRFIRSTIGVIYTHRLIDISLSEGYIKPCYEHASRCNVYYLTKAGRNLVKTYEPFIEYYKFDKKHTGLNTFKHQKFLVEIYFMLKERLEIKKWVPEWALRSGNSRWEKFPDGQIILSSGLKVAIEVETSYRDLSGWKDFIYRYSHDIERGARYHAVLVIAAEKDYLTGVILKLFNFAHEFSSKKVIFTDSEMLNRNECFYHNEVYSLKEACSLLEKECLAR